METTFEDVIRRGNFVVLDTETTGLGSMGEICQIAIVAANGETLLSRFVKPVRGIPSDAWRIHGITEAQVESAPPWGLIRPLVINWIKGHDVVIYNAVYDRKMMHQSDDAVGLPRFEYKEIAQFYCAMEWYAEIHGEWNDYHQSYRWQRLTDAMRQNDLPISDAHNALGDCLMTLALIKHLIH